MMNSGQGTMGSALGNGRRALAEEVPVGYKRTEVGVIPEDWESSSVCAIAPLDRQRAMRSLVAHLGPISCPRTTWLMATSGYSWPEYERASGFRAASFSLRQRKQNHLKRI